MEHNPLISFEDGLEVTYSDVKGREGGAFVTLYFERPCEEQRGFDSAKYDYPGESFSDVIGFSRSDLEELTAHVNKLAPLAYEFALGDACGGETYPSK